MTQLTVDKLQENGIQSWIDLAKLIEDCAINESSLFPDLDGLSRHLEWQYKWGK